MGVTAAMMKPVLESFMKLSDLYLATAAAKNAKAVRNTKGKPNLIIFSITAGSYAPVFACLL
jgi:hypothetical protein